jgi:hypothetical protein
VSTLTAIPALSNGSAFESSGPTLYLADYKAPGADGTSSAPAASSSPTFGDRIKAAAEYLKKKAGTNPNVFGAISGSNLLAQIALTVAGITVAGFGLYVLTRKAASPAVIVQGAVDKAAKAIKSGID